MRLIRRPWKGCLFWDVPFTIPWKGCKFEKWSLQKWGFRIWISALFKMLHWHGVRTLGPVSFPMLLTGRRTELVQHIHASLGGPPILLWILPAQDPLLLSDGTCALSDYDVLAFPCITYNALNGFYFPLRVVLQPVLVPALPDTAAQEHLQLLLFGLAPLHLPATRNIFFCFKNVFTFWTSCTKLCACHIPVIIFSTK